MLAIKCTLCLNELIYRATGGGQKWWDDRSSSVSFRENTFLSRTLTWTCTLVPHLVPAAPAAQCWTGIQYMLLMIQWICLQPSGEYTWSKHSHDAKIDYLWSGAARGWGTGLGQHDYVILSLLICETGHESFVSHKFNSNFEAGNGPCWEIVV